MKCTTPCIFFFSLAHALIKHLRTWGMLTSVSNGDKLCFRQKAQLTFRLIIFLHKLGEPDPWQAGVNECTDQSLSSYTQRIKMASLQIPTWKWIEIRGQNRYRLWAMMNNSSRFWLLTAFMQCKHPSIIWELTHQAPAVKEKGIEIVYWVNMHKGQNLGTGTGASS